MIIGPKNRSNLFPFFGINLDKDVFLGILSCVLGINLKSKPYNGIMFIQDKNKPSHVFIPLG